MSSIKVQNEIRVYEENEKEVPLNRNVSIRVESHWNYSDRIVLVVGDKRYTVIARDIQNAVQNSINR